MTNDLHYVPGTFYRICDRTGFKTRAYRTRKEWNGKIVRDQSWESRQPQDFVRGRKDDMKVPEPRPRQTNQFVSQTVTLPNLIASNNEQASGWTGTPAGGAEATGLQPNGVLGLFGGLQDSGTYTVLQTIDAGSVRNLQVLVNLSYLGLPNAIVTSPFDLFQIADIYGLGDMFSNVGRVSLANVSSAYPTVWTAFVSARVELRTATTAGQWSEWKPAANTIYAARYMQFRCVLTSNDINTSCIVYGFNWQVGTA